jgi:class 3 adenylate cyclase
MKKTVVELDLKGYSDIARELEEHLSAEMVGKFNDQIQSFVDVGLKAVNAHRAEVVCATTGDGAIVVFDNADQGHAFSQAVHEATRKHNAEKTVSAAQRWFRIGIATGDLDIQTVGATKKIAGSVIARAVRLEGAANVGEVVADADTFSGLSEGPKLQYGAREWAAGKREEKFAAYRCVVVSPSASVAATKFVALSSATHPHENKALSLWREKVVFYEEQLAITSSASQKFELKCQIAEAKEKIQELGG